MMELIFNEFYSKYHQDLYNFLFYLVRNKEKAEDLVQEVYIKVMKSHESFRGESSEKSWLFSIAKNTAIDYFRKHKNLVIPVDMNQSGEYIRDSNPMPEEIALQKEDIKRMYQCLNNCTQEQKSVIILRYIQELSIQETAEILNMTIPKVKVTQHRAIKRLSMYMAQ